MGRLFFRSALATAALTLSGCAFYDTGEAPETNPGYDYWATTALARDVLSELQEPSFTQNREFCGYIGLDASGTLRATPATKGRPSSCLANDPPADWTLVASYHTHGAYSVYADSEVPSEGDLIGDYEEGVNGYVSTPGGRFWHINGQAQQATLICGPGCLGVDPNYEADQSVARSYTIQQLRRR